TSSTPPSGRRRPARRTTCSIADRPRSSQPPPDSRAPAYAGVVGSATGLRPVSGRRAAKAASAGVLAVEAIGSLLMWAPIPLAWLWVGSRVYNATGSLAADGGVAILGFLATTFV